PALSRDPVFFSECRLPQSLLPSFPTRRSSDLRLNRLEFAAVLGRGVRFHVVGIDVARPAVQVDEDDGLTLAELLRCRAHAKATRTEEPTSELQSPTNLVFPPLLVKKKHNLHAY